MASIQCIIWTFSDLLLKSVPGPVQWTWTGSQSNIFNEASLPCWHASSQQTLLCWRVSAVCIFVASDIKSVWSPSALGSGHTGHCVGWPLVIKRRPLSTFLSESQHTAHSPGLQPPATCHGRHSIHFQFSAKALRVLLIFVRLFLIFSFYYSCLFV